MGHTTKLIKGYNDLQTLKPELAKELHPVKNDGLTSDCITSHSQRNVWWLGKCGHEWRAPVYSRASGRGCPYCANKKVLIGFNDLASLKPELANEWNFEKNGSLKPSDYVVSSHKNVWWICSTCGNEWHTEIRQRALHGQGCPKCAKKRQAVTYRQSLLSSRKSLIDVYPDVAKEWHPKNNMPMRASDYTPSSKKRVWWKCSKCGFEWQATISNRTTHKSGCPLCAGSVILPGVNDLQTNNPYLAAEWHPSKNLPIKPSEIAPFSKEKVWWVCKYGHEYQCRIYDRQKGVGCSECSRRFRTSLPERIIGFYIEQCFPDAVLNYRPDYLNGKEIDIYIPSLSTGIEYDGQRYHQDISRDEEKDSICVENGVTLIRVREKKCPVFERADPTIIIENNSDASFSLAIKEVLEIMGVIGKDINVTRDKQIIIEKYWSTAIEGSIKEDYPELAKEWHPTLNGGLLPENIPSTKSHDKYWWKCKKCGYSWEAVLYERISGTGCPACAGKLIIPGKNDLATTHPQLAKEWNYSKNGDLKPENVSKGSDKRVWWKCSKCGYEWATRIKKRVEGSGCTKCRTEGSKKKQNKKVYQFSLDGELISEFPNARAAAEGIGISRTSIQHACTGRLKTAGGYVWKYI